MKILFSMLYQAVRGKLILDRVTFPGWIRLPSLDKFDLTGYSDQGCIKLLRLDKVVSPARVTLPRLGNLTQTG